MRVGLRDVFAGVFVIAAVVIYALWANGVAATSLSVRGLGVAVFALGWAGCVSNQARMTALFGVGEDAQPRGSYVWIASALGAVALVAGLITLIGGAEWALVVLAASMLSLWAMATMRHALAGETQKA